MSGSHQKQKRPGARIWFLGSIAVVVFGIMMQAKPINIAARDNPPSISTLVGGFDEGNSRSMHERGTAETPPARPSTQLFYGGWTVPQ
jgi:hypothetical protein